MANYTDKSEKELQELLEELIESNETLETLLPDDDIQLEIDANNKSIKEINAMLASDNTWDDDEEEEERPMQTQGIDSDALESEEEEYIPMQTPNFEEELDAMEDAGLLEKDKKEPGLSVEELKTKINPDLLFKSGGQVKGYPKKTTVRKFFNWYAGRNWDKDTQTANTMFIDDSHAQDDGSDGLNNLSKLRNKQYKDIVLNIQETPGGYEYEFKLDGKKYYIDAMDVYGIGGVLGGALVGGYVGYKIGRARPQKTGFDTEKEIIRKAKKTKWSKDKGITYAKGGALDKEFKFDKNFVIYVPSTSDVGNKISKKELEKRVKEVEKFVANEFGGYTETDTDGGYKANSGEIIEEDIVKVSVFANNKDWKDNERKVVSKVKKWAKEWGQEAIGFEYEGDLYYIDDKGKFAKGGETRRTRVLEYPYTSHLVIRDAVKDLKEFKDYQYGGNRAGYATIEIDAKYLDRIYSNLAQYGGKAEIIDERIYAKGGKTEEESVLRAYRNDFGDYTNIYKEEQIGDFVIGMKEGFNDRRHIYIHQGEPEHFGHLTSGNSLPLNFTQTSQVQKGTQANSVYNQLKQIVTNNPNISTREAKKQINFLKYAKGGEINITDLKKGDFVYRKGSNIAVEVISVEKDKYSDYDVVELYDDLTERTQRLINLSGYEMYSDDDLSDASFSKGGTTDDVIMIEIGGDKKYPYYIKKIDTTHIAMANNKDGVDLVVPSHILQHKGESYYDDVRSWLRGGASPNGKSYDSDYYAKGGMTEEQIDDKEEKIREYAFDRLEKEFGNVKDNTYFYNFWSDNELDEKLSPEENYKNYKKWFDEKYAKGGEVEKLLKWTDKNNVGIKSEEFTTKFNKEKTPKQFREAMDWARKNNVILVSKEFMEKHSGKYAKGGKIDAQKLADKAIKNLKGYSKSWETEEHLDEEINDIIYDNTSFSESNDKFYNLHKKVKKLTLKEFPKGFAKGGVTVGFYDEGQKSMRFQQYDDREETKKFLEKNGMKEVKKDPKTRKEFKFYAKGGEIMEDLYIRQEEEEKGKTFEKYRVLVYVQKTSGGYPFAEYKTNNFISAVDFAKDKMIEQRTYRDNTERMYASIDQFIPIRERGNPIYAYAQMVSFSEKDLNYLPFAKGGSLTKKVPVEFEVRNRDFERWGEDILTYSTDGRNYGGKSYNEGFTPVNMEIYTKDLPKLINFIKHRKITQELSNVETGENYYFDKMFNIKETMGLPGSSIRFMAKGGEVEDKYEILVYSDGKFEKPIRVFSGKKLPYAISKFKEIRSENRRKNDVTFLKNNERLGHYDSEDDPLENEEYAKGGDVDENPDLISGSQALDLYASEEIFTAEQDLLIDQAIDGQDLETDEILNDFREWALYNQKDWFEEDEEISGNDRALEVFRDFNEYYNNGLTHRQNWTAFLEYAQDELPKYRKGGVLLYKDPSSSYTVVIDDSVFEMNEGTLNYSVNTYIGERSEYPEDISHWGEQISLKDAPIVIKDKIKERENTSYEKGGITKKTFDSAVEWNNATEKIRKDILSSSSCSPKYSSYSYTLLDPDTKEKVNIYFETNKEKLELSPEERDTQITMLEQALKELGGKDRELEGEIKKLKNK